MLQNQRYLNLSSKNVYHQRKKRFLHFFSILYYKGLFNVEIVRTKIRKEKGIQGFKILANY